MEDYNYPIYDDLLDNTVWVSCAECGEEFPIPSWQLDEDVAFEGKNCEHYCFYCASLFWALQ